MSVTVKKIAPVSEILEGSRAALCLAGLLLGAAGFLVSLLARGLLSGEEGLAWVRDEVLTHLVYYRGMFILFPILCAALGYYFGALRDRLKQTQLAMKSLEAVQEGQTITDATTGLYNHGHIVLEWDQEVERMLRYDRPLSGMAIVIDQFAQLKTQHDDRVISYVLKELAVLFRQSMRHIDVIGRYGEDVFFAVLPESTLEIARVVAERVQKSVHEHMFVTGSGALEISVSIVIPAFRENEKERGRDGLFSRLDEKLRRLQTNHEKGAIISA